MAVEEWWSLSIVHFKISNKQNPGSQVFCRWHFIINSNWGILIIILLKILNKFFLHLFLNKMFKFGWSVLFLLDMWKGNFMNQILLSMVKVLFYKNASTLWQRSWTYGWGGGQGGSCLSGALPCKKCLHQKSNIS